MAKNGKSVSNGGLDLGGIVGEAVNGLLTTAAEAKSGVGAAAYTGLIEDVKRAKDSGDSNALVKLGLTFLGVYAAGMVADSLIENRTTKGLSDGSSK